MTEKCHRQKGNSPDSCLRPQSVRSVEKDVGLLRQPGCWLRSSHSFKECVIAHWSSGPAPKIQRGSSVPPKTETPQGVVAERSVCRRRCPVRGAGGIGSENVGMSNEQGDENSPRRMSKVSYPTSVVVGLAGPKAQPKGAADGERVNIPVLPAFRLYDAGTRRAGGDLSRMRSDAPMPAK